MRGLAAIAAMALIAVAANGCNSGLSQSDSQQNCDQEETSKSQCFSADVYTQCVSCYQRCGQSCIPQNLCPEQYLCPGDSLSDGGTGGAGGGH